MPFALVFVAVVSVPIGALLYLAVRFRAALRKTFPDATFADVGEKGYGAIDDPLAQWIDRNYGKFFFGCFVLMAIVLAVLVMFLPEG